MTLRLPRDVTPEFRILSLASSFQKSLKNLAQQTLHRNIVMSFVVISYGNLAFSFWLATHLMVWRWWLRGDLMCSCIILPPSLTFPQLGHSTLFPRKYFLYINSDSAPISCLFSIFCRDVHCFWAAHIRRPTNKCCSIRPMFRFCVCVQTPFFSNWRPLAKITLGLISQYSITFVRSSWNQIWETLTGGLYQLNWRRWRSSCARLGRRPMAKRRNTKLLISVLVNMNHIIIVSCDSYYYMELLDW